MSNNLQFRNSKLFLLLRTLDKKEVKRFDLWLSSPFHNNSEKVINLYRGLVNQHKEFDKPISKMVLAKYIGISDDLLKPDKFSPKEDVILRRVMNQLTTQVQEFLIWQGSKENIIHEKRLLMNALLERKLYSLIPAILTKSKKELAASPYRVPIVWAYYITLCMIEERYEQDFYKLKKYLFDNLAFFDLTEVRQFLSHLINYCTQAIRVGKTKFIQEKYEIYELGLEVNCWTAGLYFSIHQFVNIVYNALLLDKIDWTNNFIQQHQVELNPDMRDDIINFCYALVAFQSKDYDTVQAYIIKINNTEDFIYHLQFKILLIKIYYEQEVLTIDNVDTHPINYELDAIRHYVMSTRNTKMSEPMRESYNNFVNLFKRILNRKKKTISKELVKPEQLNKLKQDLLAEVPFVERQWLKEKIEELV